MESLIVKPSEKEFVDIKLDVMLLIPLPDYIYKAVHFVQSLFYLVIMHSLNVQTIAGIARHGNRPLNHDEHLLKPA